MALWCSPEKKKWVVVLRAGGGGGGGCFVVGVNNIQPLTSGIRNDNQL